MAGTHSYADDAMVGIGAAAEITGFSVTTLRRYDSAGKLRVYRTPGGMRRYRVGDLRNLLTPEPNGSAA